MNAILRGIGLGLLSVALAASAYEPKMDRKQREEAAVVNAQLGMEYMRQGDLTSARDKVEKALNQDPNQQSVQMAAAFLYDRLGDDEKAEAAFERAVDLGKGDPDVLNNFGAFLCRKGDKKRGESYFLEAARSPVYRTPASAYANAGRCARADERPKDAEQYFPQALAIKANGPGIAAPAGCGVGVLQSGRRRRTDRPGVRPVRHYCPGLRVRTAKSTAPGS